MSTIEDKSAAANERFRVALIEFFTHEPNNVLPDLVRTKLIRQHIELSKKVVPNFEQCSMPDYL
jgi:hypothetical protein